MSELERKIELRILELVLSGLAERFNDLIETVPPLPEGTYQEVSRFIFASSGSSEDGATSAALKSLLEVARKARAQLGEQRSENLAAALGERLLSLGSRHMTFMRSHGESVVSVSAVIQHREYWTLDLTSETAPSLAILGEVGATLGFHLGDTPAVFFHDWGLPLPDGVTGLIARGRGDTRKMLFALLACIAASSAGMAVGYDVGAAGIHQTLSDVGSIASLLSLIALAAERGASIDPPDTGLTRGHKGGRRSSSSDRQEAVRRLQVGETADAIADDYGVKPDTVRKWSRAINSLR